MKAVLAQLMIEDESLAELISIAISLGPQRAQICSGLASSHLPTYANVACHRHEKDTVAIKIMQPGLANSPAGTAGFLSELRFWKSNGLR